MATPVLNVLACWQNVYKSGDHTHTHTMWFVLRWHPTQWSHWSHLQTGNNGADMSTGQRARNLLLLPSLLWLGLRISIRKDWFDFFSQQQEKASHSRVLLSGVNKQLWFETEGCIPVTRCNRRYWFFTIQTHTTELTHYTLMTTIDVMKLTA